MEQSQLPETDRLSVLSAAILLAYALTRFIDIPARDFSFQFPGVFIEFQFNLNTIVAFLVAGMTASGTDWLLRQHPKIAEHTTLEHLLLPGLTALVIGIPISQMEPGLQWWAGFAAGGVLLMLVLVAEYIAVDPDDIRQPAAAVGLTAVSFALYLILAVALRVVGFRLFLILPALTLAASLVSLRALHLRLKRWALVEAAIIGLLCGQLAAALHYLPLSPVSFGLAVLAPAYSLTSFIANLAENEPLRKAVVEPGVVLVIILATALWLR
jgi:hypothetical protein